MTEGEGILVALICAIFAFLMGGAVFQESKMGYPMDTDTKTLYEVIAVVDEDAPDNRVELVVAKLHEPAVNYFATVSKQCFSTRRTSSKYLIKDTDDRCIWPRAWPPARLLE